MEFNIDEMPVSTRLDQVVEKNLQKLYREQRINRTKKILKGVGSFAAVVACVMLVGVKNQAFASQIPLVGSVFEKVQGILTFSGNYSHYESQLIHPKEDKKGYTKTIGDMTVTLSEIYCNNESISVATILNSKKGFSKEMRKAKQFYCEGKEKFSFLSSEIDSSVVEFDGKFTDTHTWMGIMRIAFDFDYQKPKVPDKFKLKICMDQIVGEYIYPQKVTVSKKDMHRNPEEEFWFDGPWEFTLDVRKDKKDVQTVPVGTNTDGVGFKKMIKTPVELSLYPTAPNSLDHYIPIVVDADGQLMNEWTGNLSNIAIGNHNVSKVNVYMFDAFTWLDEIKSEYWKKNEKVSGKTFTRLCNEKSLYHKTIYFK